MRVKYIRYILPPGQSTFKHWSFKKLQRKDVGAIPFEGVGSLGGGEIRSKHTQRWPFPPGSLLSNQSRPSFTAPSVTRYKMWCQSELDLMCEGVPAEK